MSEWRPVDFSKGGPYECQFCGYARPASEGPKGSFMDKLTEMRYQTRKTEIWCPKRNMFRPKNLRNRNCGSWHYGE